MEFRLHSFRTGLEMLQARDAWTSLLGVIHATQPTDIVATHERIASERRTPPAGGQTALNAVFRERLGQLGWRERVPLFTGQRDIRRWIIDYSKDGIGLDVSFNHAEAIPLTFARLSLAARSDRVIEANRIDVGVAVYASASMKSWARMDGAVGRFETAATWLDLMEPLLPAPLVIVGLEAEGWPTVSAFRGTRTTRNVG